MNLLILKGFNNYFNRKIIKYSTLQDYIDNSSLQYDFENVNFNPNDGVATSQIIGSENQVEIGGSEPEPLKWEFEGTPDYIVCYDKEIINDNPVFHIRSRWFILECVRTRLGQYQLALKRDVLADHLEQVLTNPCFVEKGYVKPDDPLIFNQENISVNEIKNYKGEHPSQMLTDETGIPWLVLYIAHNAPTGAAKVVEGKQVLDTQDAIMYSELPWKDIEPGTALSNTAVTRRIAGAGEINITPIIANKGNWDKKFFVGPYRANCRYHYYNNDWHLDTNTAGIQRIGTDTVIDHQVIHDQGSTDWNDTWGRVLKRGDLKGSTGAALTPTGNNVLWSDDGAKVPTLTWEQTTASYDNYTKAAANYVLSAMNLTTANNTAAHVASIKSYLTTKKTYYEADMSHAPVPGQTNMEAYVGGPQAFLPASELLKYNGKLVTNDNITFYKIKVTRQNNYTRPIDYFKISGSEVVANSSNSIKQWITTNSSTSINGKTFIQNTSNTMVETYFEHAWFDIQYQLVTSDILQCTVQQEGSADRLSLNDVAYDMIVLPYGSIDFHVMKGATELSKTSSAAASIGIARAIAADLGSGFYDMQLLPYCPWRAAVNDYVENGYINITSGTPGNQTLPLGCWFGVYKLASSGDTPDRDNTVSFALWCPQSHGTFDIEHRVATPEPDSIEYKVFNECKKFRLVSPNYASGFDFMPLKNNGVTRFNVDYNYRPYNPYIHIAPIFDGLYGVDENDNRGLILQGDFSVGYYSDKWAEYQIQNANYANMFNREMQNLERNQKLEVQQHAMAGGFDAVANTFGAARAGSNTGNPIADALMGTQMLGKGFQGQLIGAAADAYFMGKAMGEARSFKRDMHEMQLGNIQALPYGLAKSDALTENYKYFPFVEEYDCTEKEVELFKAKLKYDGMLVGAIGTLADYIPETYEIQRLKGQLIMQDDLVDDFQIAEDIYKEVDKGFYLVNKGE